MSVLGQMCVFCFLPSNSNRTLSCDYFVKNIVYGSRRNENRIRRKRRNDEMCLLRQRGNVPHSRGQSLDRFRRVRDPVRRLRGRVGYAR